MPALNPLRHAHHNTATWSRARLTPMRKLTSQQTTLQPRLPLDAPPGIGLNIRNLAL